MARVQIDLECNDIVLSLPGVKRSVREGADDIEGNAEAILRAVRATTPHKKMAGPDRLTYISKEPAKDSTTDWFVSLNAPNPIAIEYGHQPSGFFAGTDTKAPDGLYILHKAAGLA
jgi:hypothetical protein